MAAIVTNPTPKSRFQSVTTNVSQHRDMVGGAAFQRAADYAMLEYQALLADRTNDAQTAVAAGMKLQGALEFLTQFRLLAETPTVAPRVVPRDNLDQH